MKVKFDNYLKHIFIAIIAVVAFHSTAFSQCNPILKTSPTLLEGCEDFTVQFLDSTFTDPAVCIIQKRRWNFGDGSPFTGTQNPVHVYTAGVLGDTTYTAWLAIQDQFNVWDSVSVNIKVNKIPEVEFTLSKDTVCAFNESFCTQNVSESGNGYTYLWDFQNAFSGKYDTCYTFDSEGDYTVRLTVTDNQGCINSYEQEIAVNEIPNPDFTITPFSGCHPLNATFTNTTNEGKFPIESWSWNFAGYGNSTSKDPSGITFPDPGLFAIKLTATNSAGCVNTTENNFLVRETPTAEFSYEEEVCLNVGTFPFYTGTGTINASIEWTFKDAVVSSGTGSGPIPTMWAIAGEHEIQLVVTENACSDTIIETIKINDLPIVSLTSDAEGDSICEAEPITFTASPDSFVTYQFLDQGILVQDSSINYYTTDTLKANNDITVIAVDSNNCSSSASSNLQITVLSKPLSMIISSAQNDTICKGDPITFTATGTFDSFKFLDDFAILQNGPLSNYSTSDLEPQNNIKVIPTHLGCEGYQSNIITTEIIEPLETPQLNCGESTTNSVEWVWSVSDGSLGYEISVNGGLFEAPNNGQFGHFLGGMSNGDSAVAYVRAIGEAPCGNSLMSDTIKCIATPCKQVLFNPFGTLSYCELDTSNLGFNGISGVGPYQISWNDSIVTDSNQIFPLSGDTTLLAKLQDLGQPGCPIFKHNFELKVNSLPRFSATVNLDTVCKKDKIQVTVDSSGFENYKFFVNGIEKQDSTYYEFTTSFENDLDKEIVIKTTDFGCSYFDTLSVYVVPTPPNELTLEADSICEGETSNFSGTPGYVRYVYEKYNFITNEMDLLLDSTLNSYSVQSNNDDDIIITLTAYDQNGCSSLLSRDTAIVKTTPVTSFFFHRDTICAGEPPIVKVNTHGYDQYELFQNYSLISTNDSGIFHINNYIDGKYLMVKPTHQNCIGPFSTPQKPNILTPIEPPSPNCGTTGNGKIDFVWDPVINNEGYALLVDGSPTSPNGNHKHSISGLSAGDTVRFEISAKSSAACGNSVFSEEIFCIMPCEGVTFTKEPHLNRICIGDSIPLAISNINTPKSDYLIDWTGFPISKDSNVVATPSSTGEIEIIVSVFDTTQSHCPPTIKKFKTQVDGIPIVTLSGPSSICGDTALTFTASPTSYDRYSFYDGYVMIQDTIDPELIDLEAEDGHFYRVVTQNGVCYDTSNSISINVSDPLEAPDAYCGASGLDSIDLRWDSVPGATGYEISINEFPWSTPNGSLLHSLKNLAPQDSVSFEIRALGDLPCGPGPRSQKVYCVAKPCLYKNFDLRSDTTICNYDTITVAATSPVSISNQRGFSWDGGVNFSSLSSREFSPINDTTIRLIMIDSTQLQCPFIEKEVNISVHPIPEFILNNSTTNDTVCEGEIVIFTADTAGFDIYQMYINNFLVQDSNYFAFQTDSMDDGTHLIYMTAYDDICYFTSDTQIVTIVSFPELILTSSDFDLEICDKDTIAFTANSGFEEYSFYEVIGTDTTLLYAGPDSIYSSNSLVNGSTIFVEGENANTCSKTTASFNFKVNPIPTPVLTSSDNNNIICGLDTLTFTVSPDTLDNYQFYDDGELVDFGSHIYITDSLKPGNKIYAVATEDGCSNTTDSISTSVEFTPTITTGLDTFEICEGDTISLWVTGGTSKTWSNGETTDTIRIAPEDGVDIWVTGTTGNCTSPADTFNIDIDTDIPLPYPGEDTTICINDSIELFASGGMTYKWFPADSVTDPTGDVTTAFPLSTKQIILEAKNTHCIRRDSLLLTIDLCLSELPDDYVPNGVTPNDDGTNDTWDIPYIWYFESNNVKIYNRWSNLVFEKQYYLGDWRGTNKNGNPLPDGTYFYVLDLGNGREPYLGYIVLHR